MSTMTKRYAVYLREKPAFQVVREAQYAFEAYELARAELATKWEDYSIGFADCEVVDVEEQSRARAARRVGAERGARA